MVRPEESVMELKNETAVNGILNGERKMTRYRPDNGTLSEIRSFQSPVLGGRRNVNIPNAIQLGRRIRGEQA